MLNEIWGLWLERRDFFVELLLQHLKLTLIASVIAIILGGIIGVIISEKKRLAAPMMSIINVIYTIPSISLLGILIPFSGIGDKTALIALVLYALLPMVRNTYTGIQAIDALLIEAAKGMGSTSWQILFRIKLPLAMPIIISGIRNMMIMTVALAGIASFIGAGGLGVAIYRGITTNNFAMIVIGSVLIAALALALDFVVARIEKWYAQPRKRRKSNILWGSGGIVGVICALFFMSMPMQATINVATKPLTEQYVIGEMLRLLIEENTDLKVAVKHGIGGGTANIHPGIRKGDFDIYPEYTGTSWQTVLKQPTLYTPDKFSDLQQSYQSMYQLEWIGLYGFNNTYGLAVSKSVAERYQLKTYSDLQAVSSQLVLGAEYDFFEREDGYNALKKLYGFSFKDTKDMDIGLKYQALQKGEIDVAVIFTTDGQLSSSNLVVLEDDRQFFPSYDAGSVIRQETLMRHSELRPVLEKLKGAISNADMARLNHLVEAEGQAPKEVARQFLKEKGLIK